MLMLYKGTVILEKRSEYSQQFGMKAQIFTSLSFHTNMLRIFARAHHLLSDAFCILEFKKRMVSGK